MIKMYSKFLEVLADPKDLSVMSVGPTEFV